MDLTVLITTPIGTKNMMYPSITKVIVDKIYVFKILRYDRSMLLFKILTTQHVLDKNNNNNNKLVITSQMLAATVPPLYDSSHFTENELFFLVNPLSKITVSLWNTRCLA